MMHVASDDRGNRDVRGIPRASDLRSDGVLNESEIAACKARGVPLAYDPVQIGWVRADCVDDLVESETPNEAKHVEAYGFRAWTPDDAPELARILSIPELWTYLPEDFTGAIDAAAAQDLVELANAASHHDVRAVTHDGRIIGQVRLVFEGDRSAEISYWFDPEVWGQGHGRAVVQRFTPLAFNEHPDLEKLVAKVQWKNPASARILQAAGYAEDDQRSDDTWQWFTLVRSTADFSV